MLAALVLVCGHQCASMVGLGGRVTRQTSNKVDQTNWNLVALCLSLYGSHHLLAYHVTPLTIHLFPVSSAHRKLDSIPVDEDLRATIRSYCTALVSALNRYYAFGSVFVDDSQ